MSDFDIETARDVLIESPVTSVRGLLTYYGTLAVAASPFEGEDSMFYSSKYVDTMVNDGGKIVAPRIDLTGDKATFDRSEEDLGIDLESIEKEDLSRLGIMKKKSGVSHDHSISHEGSKNGSTPEQVADYFLGTFVSEGMYKPPLQDNSVKEIFQKELHKDHNLVRKLYSLAEEYEKHANEDDLDVSDTTLGQIHNSIEKRLNSEETVVVSAKFNVPESTEGHQEGWQLPGEIDVLNKIGKRKKSSDFSSTGKDVENSVGQGTGFVSREQGEVYGTPPSPLNLYAAQHKDDFQNMNGDESWRSQPITAEVAALIKKGGNIIEENFKHRYVRNGNSDGERELYTIPYFIGTPSADELKELHTVIEAYDKTSSMIEIYKEVNEARRPRLRFCLLMVDSTGDDYDLVSENFSVRVPPVLEVAKNYAEVQQYAKSKDSPTIEAARDIQNGTAAYRALGQNEEEKQRFYNSRTKITVDLLCGNSIRYDPLVELFHDKLVFEMRGKDDKTTPPSINDQFAILTSVLKAGFFIGWNENATPMSIDTDDPHGFIEQYLSDKKAIASSGDRTASFSLGALVGFMSKVQSDLRSMQGTYEMAYPADSVTKEQANRILPKMTSKLAAYEKQDSENPDVFRMGRQVEETASSVLSSSPPSEWELSNKEFRFYYALGITTGKQAYQTAAREE